MGNQNKGLYDDLSLTPNSSEPQIAPKVQRPSPEYFKGRHKVVAGLTSKDKEEKTLLKVDPKRCKMWKGHDRDYSLLSKERCSDLIDGFLSQGRQEFPAIVRTVDDSNYDFEVICGARRHWTATWLRENNYPEFDFLIEVRTLTDEAAFRLSEIENRDREDISDYERALSYKNALDEYYVSQIDMAKRLNVDEKWLSNFIKLAELPTEIINAYRDITEIRIHHGRVLRPLLKDRKLRLKVVNQAKDLARIQNTEKEKLKEKEISIVGALERSLGKTGEYGKLIIKYLVDSTKAKAKGEGVLKEYQSSDGENILVLKSKGKNGLIINLPINANAKKSELVAAFREMVAEFY